MNLLLIIVFGTLVLLALVLMYGMLVLVKQSDKDLARALRYNLRQRKQRQGGTQ